MPKLPYLLVQSKICIGDQSGDILSALTSAEHTLPWHLSLALDEKYLLPSVSFVLLN